MGLATNDKQFRDMEKHYLKRKERLFGKDGLFQRMKEGKFKEYPVIAEAFEIGGLCKARRK